MARDAAWILTATGRQFWPLDPRPEDICIEDIAHHLSMQCRFTGACRFHYSVAQHSVLVSRCAPAGEDPMWGLLHDAAEAYLVDVARPLKKTPGFSAYREAETRVMEAISSRFGLPKDEPAWVAKADVVLLATEWRDVMPPQPHPWSESDPMSKSPTPLGDRIQRWTPAFAEARFLDRFEELTARPIARHCPDCGGTGRRGADERCDSCRGEGQVPDDAPATCSPEAPDCVRCGGCEGLDDDGEGR